VGGVLGLLCTLVLAATEVLASSVVLAVFAAAQAIALVSGFAESSIVDRLVGGRRSAPKVFLRLVLSVVFTMLSTIAVCLIFGLVRVTI
jgi:hypothetical protein